MESAGERDYRGVRTALGLFVGCKYCIACRSYRHWQGRRKHGHAAMHKHISQGRDTDGWMVLYTGPSRYGSGMTNLVFRLAHAGGVVASGRVGQECSQHKRLVVTPPARVITNPYACFH